MIAHHLPTSFQYSGTNLIPVRTLLRVHKDWGISPSQEDSTGPVYKMQRLKLLERTQGCQHILNESTSVNWTVTALHWLWEVGTHHHQGEVFQGRQARKLLHQHRHCLRGAVHVKVFGSSQGSHIKSCSAD